MRPYPVGRVLVAVLAAAVGWSFCTMAAERTPKRAPAPKAAKVARAAAPIGSTTLPIALVQAYVNNPQLNAQRANTRAIDENVSIALGGYRPRVTATSSIAEAFLDTTQASGSLRSRQRGSTEVTTLGITATQTLFNGFQTGNRTRQAEAQVFSSRETLRTSEQTTLLNAAIAYMNLSRDAAVLELQRSNVTVLEATLQQTRDRFNVGEVTRTDVAQSESRLAAGRSQLLTAESNYTTSRANYRQVIGVDPPARLAPAMGVDRFSPSYACRRPRAREHPASDDHDRGLQR